MYFGISLGLALEALSGLIFVCLLGGSETRQVQALC